MAVDMERTEHERADRPMVTAMPAIAHMLINGNFHRDPSLRWMHLGKVSDHFMDALRDECSRVVLQHPPSNVNHDDHITNWTKPTGEVRQWSLFNRSGRTDDTSADFDYFNLDIKKPPKGFDAIATLIRSIPDLVNLRLNGLGPDSALSPHEEHLPLRMGSQYVGMRCRFHIPLVTNDEAWMLADEQITNFEEGRLYAFNNGCVHAAGNTDPRDWRYHLVFDCLMTERLYRTLLDPLELHDSPEWLFWRTQIMPVTDYPVTEWEYQGGMPDTMFDLLDFVWMPDSNKDAS